MRKLIPIVLSLCLSAPSLLAEDKREKERLESCGTVIQEIMDIPDNIPQDLIDKADCVIVYPSVVKAAFIFGGSYGRGALERSHDDGPRRRQFRVPDRWSSNRLRPVGHEWPRRSRNTEEQSEARSRCFGRGGSQGTHGGSLDRRHDAGGDPLLLEGSRS